MAGLVRLRSVQKMLCRMPIIRAQQTNLIRAVGTSNAQKNETVAPSVPKIESAACTTESKPIKPWISAGFSYEEEKLDNHLMHLCFFSSITLLFTIGAWLYAYLPDFRMKDWALREAYLELRHREQNGLPLIDPNYIHPSKMILPSDEELGDTDIII